MLSDVKTHSARYTGRGLDWARKPITRRRARRIARYHIGLVIDAVINDGWGPDDLCRRYGPEGMETIKEEMMDLARWLGSTGHPDGSPSR